MISNLTWKIQSAFSPAYAFPSHIRLVRVRLDMLLEKCKKSGLFQAGTIYLTEKERARFEAFRFEKRKLEWLAGRIAAKCAALQLEQETDTLSWDEDQWRQVAVEADDNGKPFIRFWGSNTRKQPMISISHSKEIAVGLACWSPCGVDIQEITPAVERVQDRFATEEEKKILHEIEGQYGVRSRLALLWAAKEAVKKAAASAAMPGFLDICLQSLDQTEQGLVFSVAVKNMQLPQSEMQTVWMSLLDNYTFALTF